MSQRAFITGDGRSVVLPAGRTGAGGQGQVFRSQLGRQPIAVKLCRQLEEARLISLQRLEPTCGTIATLPHQRLYHCRDGQRGALAGYAMRLVASKGSVSAARLFNFEEIAGLQRFTWKDAVLAALRLAESVAQLQQLDFQPALALDVAYVVQVGLKLAIDLLNCHNPRYVPRLLGKLSQQTLVCNSNDDHPGREAAGIFS